MKPIWIVDDDHSIRFVLEKALAREQFSVRSFASAREVLSALDDEEPQVMVSDIRMPGGSGIDLLSKVKARLPGLPVIDTIAERLGARTDGERAAALELALEALYLAKKLDKTTGEGETVYG